MKRFVPRLVAAVFALTFLSLPAYATQSMAEPCKMATNLVVVENVNGGRAQLNVRNDLDRAVTLDMEGDGNRRHYELTVGDRHAAKIEIDPATYRIRLTAPSFKVHHVNDALLKAGKGYELHVRKDRDDCVEPR